MTEPRRPGAFRLDEADIRETPMPEPAPPMASQPPERTTISAWTTPSPPPPPPRRAGR